MYSINLQILPLDYLPIVKNLVKRSALISALMLGVAKVAVAQLQLGPNTIGMSHESFLEMHKTNPSLKLCETGPCKAMKEQGALIYTDSIAEYAGCQASMGYQFADERLVGMSLHHSKKCIASVMQKLDADYGRPITYKGSAAWYQKDANGEQVTKIYWGPSSSEGSYVLTLFSPDYEKYESLFQ